MQIYRQLGQQREQLNGESVVPDAIELFSLLENYVANKYRFTHREERNITEAIMVYCYLLIKGAKRDADFTDDGLSSLLGESGAVVLSIAHVKEMMNSLATFLNSRQSLDDVINHIKRLIIQDSL